MNYREPKIHFDLPGRSPFCISLQKARQKRKQERLLQGFLRYTQKQKIIFIFVKVVIPLSLVTIYDPLKWNLISTIWITKISADIIRKLPCDTWNAIARGKAHNDFHMLYVKNSFVLKLTILINLQVSMPSRESILKMNLNLSKLEYNFSCEKVNFRLIYPTHITIHSFWNTLLSS